jgi:hypothetical protein
LRVGEETKCGPKVKFAGAVCFFRHMGKKIISPQTCNIPKKIIFLESNGVFSVLIAIGRAGVFFLMRCEKLFLKQAIMQINYLLRGRNANNEKAIWVSKIFTLRPIMLITKSD